MPTWSALVILAVSIGVMSWASVRLTALEGFGARLRLSEGLLGMKLVALAATSRRDGLR
ncbi:MAG: hypothetical protein WCE51_11665 [Chthoniobacterales bacterium]|jgi:hypothetical protein